MSEHAARVQPRGAELADVRIVRACTRCGHQRAEGEPCAGCGNPEPPLVHRLGVQSAVYRNPLRQAWWNLTGSRLAARRARKANAEAARLGR